MPKQNSKILVLTKIFLTALAFILISNSQVKATYIDHLDPLDNGNVSSSNLGNNLQIYFNQFSTWDLGNMGNLTLEMENGAGNWTTVESFFVGSPQISGLGTNVLSINPLNDLLNNKCYRITINPCFLVIPNVITEDDTTCSYNSGYVRYLVIGGESWSFTTGSGICSSSGPPWYNDNWMHRQKITIQHSKVNGDLADFPVYLRLSDFGDSFFNVVKEDGSDIVITSSDMVTKLPRELEFIDTTDKKGALWFKASNLYNTSNTDFYMYYGYSAATEINDTATWKTSYQNVSHLHETPTNSDLDAEFQDSTSKNNDVKSIGAMDLSDRITGQIGWGVDLDGTNDYLDFGNIASISGASNFTLSAWIRPTSTSGQMPIYAKGTSSTISLMHNGSEWKGSSNSDSLDTMYHTKSLARNTSWIYSVMVFDASQLGNNRFKIYVNGEVLNSMTYSTINNLSGGIGASLFAGRQNSTNNQFYGDLDLDELRVSNSSHSAPWIKTEYLNQFSPSTFYSIGNRESGGVGDTLNPRISSLSPADNASNVKIDTNLIINFSEAVDTKTGNLTIKKSADDFIVQTLNITSATGNGTSTLTFNPNDLANNTSYYVQIDATAVDDLNGNSYAGISDKTTWNFTTEPVLAWMDNNWLQRVKFTVNANKVNGSVSDFPVYLNLSDFSFTNLFNNTRTDGADIRITQGDGLSVLASELVHFNAVANLGELHFKAPLLSDTANADFYMYFNNPNARPINASDPLGKHDVWSEGFVAVYHMQENPSGDLPNSIFNSARNKYHGKPYGSMTSTNKVTGQMGNGTDFDGINDYYETDDISEIDNATKLTYSMWFKRRNSGSKILIDKSTLSSSTEMAGIHVWNSGNVHLQFRNGDQNEATFSSNDTNWHHVMSVFNGGGASSATKIIGFHDGTSQSLSYSGTLPTKLPINSSKFLIGKRNNDSSLSDGFMDEIRIASKIRSPQWAGTEFNNQSSSSTFYTIGSSVENKSAYLKPKINSLYPRNSAIQVPTKANLKINFDGTIYANTGNITIKKVNENTTFATIAINSGNVSISGSNLTINPSADLDADTEYYVLMDADIVRGSCGTSSCGFSGISFTRGWRFKTTGSHIKEVIFHDIGF